MTNFVTKKINVRNLNCKGRSLLWNVRTCLQMPKFIFPCWWRWGIIDMRVDRESWMILAKVSQHFISYFSLIRALKLYRCPLTSKSLAFVSNISTLRVSLLCGDTETQPCLVIYLWLFISIQQKTWTLKKCLQHCLQW